MTDRPVKKDECGNRDHCDAHIWVEERGNILDKKIVTVCTDVKLAHTRIDQKVGQTMFTWIIGGLCCAFVLSMSILLWQFGEQQRLAVNQFIEQKSSIDKMDGKLNILVYQVSQIEKRTENITKK